MRLILMIILFFSNLALANKVKVKSFYGSDFTTSAPHSLQVIVDNFGSFETKDIVIKAKVKKVCVKKGCWMTFHLPKHSVRVKFKNYSFFVPLSLEGREVLVNGRMGRKKISIDDTKHYLEDASASKEKIAAVTHASYEYHFVASGVKLAP